MTLNHCSLTKDQKSSNPVDSDPILLDIIARVNVEVHVPIKVRADHATIICRVYYGTTPHPFHRSGHQDPGQKERVRSLKWATVNNG